MDDVVHSKAFKYIFIPAQIENEVEELLMPANSKEDDFRNLLKKCFGSRVMSEKNQKEFLETIKSEVDKSASCVSSSTSSSTISPTSAASGTTISGESMLSTLSSSIADGSYQIIPLTLPKKDNNYEAINCYIDAVGAVKKLNVNSRASRITTDNIHGDCFISKTFDDEISEFRRLDFTMAEYKYMLEYPVDKTGRWDQNKALEAMIKQQQGGTTSTGMDKLLATSLPQPQEVYKCENCGKRGIGDNVKNEAVENFVKKLYKCSRCSKVCYCSTECQKSDWRFHKRICTK